MLRSWRGVASPFLGLATAAHHSLNSARSYSSLSSVIEADPGSVRVQGYLPNGFLVNNVQVEGAILCYQDVWLLWDVQEFNQITPETLAFLDLVGPKPDIFVLGCGGTLQQPSGPVKQFLAERGIAVEALDTKNAISYFNFMHDEGRLTVAALLPIGDAAGDNAEES